MKPTPEFPYTRLPGTFRGFIRRASLWVAPDHLLSVSGTRFGEEYRRFYYRDVEAIVIRKCSRAGSLGVWLSTGAVALVAAIQARQGPAPIARTIAALLLLFLLCRIVLSVKYSCRCYIQTAVSREELPSIIRTWTAERVLARLRAKIQDAQGVLEDDISALREARTPDAIPPVAVASISEEHGATSSSGIRFAMAAFILLLVDAAESFWQSGAPAHLTNSNWLRLFTVALVLGELCTITVGLLSIQKERTLRPLRNLLLAGLGFLAIEVWLSLYFRQFFTAETAALRMQLSFDQAWHWVQIVAGSGALLLGTGGLILILLNWESYRRGDLSTA